MYPFAALSQLSVVRPVWSPAWALRPLGLVESPEQLARARRQPARPSRQPAPTWQPLALAAWARTSLR